MIEWSATDLLIRDSIREFIDKEIRPNIDALESGEMTPYPIIRKLFSSFGVDVMATEAVNVLLEKQGAKDAAREAGEPLTTSRTKEPGGSPLGGQESLGLIAIKELAGVSLGLVASVGVSLGLGAATILSRGTLAQKKRWLPELVTFEKVAAWAITEPDLVGIWHRRPLRRCAGHPQVHPPTGHHGAPRSHDETRTHVVPLHPRANQIGRRSHAGGRRA